MLASPSSTPTSIAVAICTYNRNEPLRVLLNAIIECAKRIESRASIAVVVIDDSTDGKAKSVAQGFDKKFELGIHYQHSGKQNISLARNAAIEAASALAIWTVMIDDDCEPVANWLETLLDVQMKTSATAVTGPMVRRVPANSPKWLVNEPFLELGIEHPPDCSEVTVASTFNSMILSQWIKDHPTVRFQPTLGVLGGEDMVFYRAANAAGLRIFFSEKAAVYENEPPERATLSYQFRVYFWHGNSSYVSSVRSGVSRYRMLLHGVNSLRKALLRPLLRIFHGEKAQWRYSFALILHSIGKIAGFFGISVSHK